MEKLRGGNWRERVVNKYERAGVDGDVEMRCLTEFADCTSHSRNRGESENSVPSSSRYLATMGDSDVGKSAESPGPVG